MSGAVAHSLQQQSRGAPAGAFVQKESHVSGGLDGVLGGVGLGENAHRAEKGTPAAVLQREIATLMRERGGLLLQLARVSKQQSTFASPGCSGCI